MVELKIDDAKCKTFYGKIEKLAKDRINASTVLTVNQKTSLESVLEEIIKSKPEELLAINNKYVGLFFPNLVGDELNNYINSTKIIRNSAQYADIHREYTEVIRIFDYKNLVGNKYDIADLLGINTCVYCNSIYVKTIGSTSNKVRRAEYDHWYNKSHYPLLALSFYNLVPSCPFCNKLKLNKKFDLTSHFHPYTLKSKDIFKFSYIKKSLKDNNVVIVDEENLSDKNKNLIEVFKLDKLYNAHSATELKELLDLRFKYNKNYIDDLINVHFKGILSEKEVYRMIFGIEKEPKDFSKRPMSKFKNDIIEELMRIK
ncbi:MAG: hypothetical protein LBI73_14410 [Myroides sp.]|jgi:hypothetical protein|nr:hypothetical protein [Myroides sp.]